MREDWPKGFYDAHLIVLLRDIDHRLEQPGLLVGLLKLDFKGLDLLLGGSGALGSEKDF